MERQRFDSRLTESNSLPEWLRASFSPTFLGIHDVGRRLAFVAKRDKGELHTQHATELDVLLSFCNAISAPAKRAPAKAERLPI